MLDNVFRDKEKTGGNRIPWMKGVRNKDVLRKIETKKDTYEETSCIQNKLGLENLTITEHIEGKKSREGSGLPT